MRGFFLIMARGGSKRLPGKNIKELNGKPLICYSIDCAVAIAPKEMVCVSTDCEQIKSVVEDYGINVPFVRPSNLAEDNSSSEDAMLHAVDYFESKYGVQDYLVLLQPTSPFRNSVHVKEAIDLFLDTKGIDMVVSVTKPRHNPFNNTFVQNESGFLTKVFKSDEMPADVYSYNGAIYVININSLRKYKRHSAFQKIVKYEMDELHSIDIDENIDWLLAEQIISNKLI